MPATLTAELNWTAIIMGINSFLITIVLVLGGYIWRKALTDLDEFRSQNREEHKAFMDEIGSVKEDLAYMRGAAAAHDRKKS